MAVQVDLLETLREAAVPSKHGQLRPFFIQSVVGLGKYKRQIPV